MEHQSSDRRQKIGASHRGGSSPRALGSPAIALVAPLLIACFVRPFAVRGLWAQVSSGAVVIGRVRGSIDLPGRILVRLFAEGDVPAGESFTDSSGTVSFRSLPSGTYWVVIQVQGYRPFRQVVVVDMRISPHVHVDCLLEPMEEQRAEPSQVISGSPGSYQFNAKKPERAFDPKALREYEKANKLRQKGDFPSAIAHYEKALEIAPDFYPALNNLGAIYLRQKDIPRAEAAFLKSLELSPEDAEAYINLGHVLYDEGKYQAAIQRLEEGLKKSPRSALGHFFLGSAYLKIGQLERAEPDLKLAYSLDPSAMVAARLQLANLYLRRHDPQAAAVELEGYLQANPSDPQAPAIRKMLANLKGR